MTKPKPDFAKIARRILNQRPASKSKKFKWAFTDSQREKLRSELKAIARDRDPESKFFDALGVLTKVWGKQGPHLHLDHDDDDVCAAALAHMIGAMADGGGFIMSREALAKIAPNGILRVPKRNAA